MAKTSLLALMARLAAAFGLTLAAATGNAMAWPAAAGQLSDSSPDPAHRWLECRAAAARVAEVADAAPSDGLPAGLTLAEREAMHARAIEHRVTRRLEAMDPSGRVSGELEALAAQLARDYGSPHGARRARDVLAACEAELAR